MSEEKTNVEENVTPQTTENETESVTTQSNKDTYITDAVPTRRFFGSRKEDANFLRDKWILSKISDKDLLEYLKLEKERVELLQHAKEARGKRLLSAFEITLSLVSVVAAVYFLKDEPTILMSILYICGLLVALWILKRPEGK